MELKTPQEAKERFIDFIHALWNLVDRSPEACKKAGFHYIDTGSSWRKTLLRIQWEDSGKKRTINLLHSGIGMECNSLPYCHICEAEDLEHYFTSRHDGTILCPGCHESNRHTKTTRGKTWAA